MNQANQKVKKTYTTPEINLLGILLFPEDDFTKIDLKDAAQPLTNSQTKS